MFILWLFFVAAVKICRKFCFHLPCTTHTKQNKTKQLQIRITWSPWNMLFVALICGIVSTACGQSTKCACSISLLLTLYASFSLLLSFQNCIILLIWFIYSIHIPAGLTYLFQLAPKNAPFIQIGKLIPRSHPVALTPNTKTHHSFQRLFMFQRLSRVGRGLGLVLYMF